MAEALLRGILAANRMRPEEIVATDVRDERLAHLETTYRIAVSSDNAAAARQTETILLAVKPQHMDGALAELKGAVGEAQLLISIAAGSRRRPSRHLSVSVRVIRVMPNTPASFLKGERPDSGRHATARDLETARQLFEAVGKVVDVTSRSWTRDRPLRERPGIRVPGHRGVGDAGVKVGLPRDVALALAAQTVRGSARLVLETGKHPQRSRTWSPLPEGPRSRDCTPWSRVPSGRRSLMPSRRPCVARRSWQAVVGGARRNHTRKGACS